MNPICASLFANSHWYQFFCIQLLPGWWCVICCKEVLRGLSLATGCCSYWRSFEFQGLWYRRGNSPTWLPHRWITYTLSALHWKSTCIVYCNFSSYKLLHQWQRPGCQSLKGSFCQEFFNFESLRLLPCITSFVSALHPKSLRTILVHVPCSAAISLLNKKWLCHSQYAKVEGAQYGCGGHGKL